MRWSRGPRARPSPLSRVAVTVAVIVAVADRLDNVLVRARTHLIDVKVAVGLGPLGWPSICLLLPLRDAFDNVVAVVRIVVVQHGLVKIVRLRGCTSPHTRARPPSIVSRMQTLSPMRARATRRTASEPPSMASDSSPSSSSCEKSSSSSSSLTLGARAGIGPASPRTRLTAAPVARVCTPACRFIARAPCS